MNGSPASLPVSNILSKPGCVILASGFGRRFGGNKLAETVDGVPLIRRALAAVPQDMVCATVLVTQYPAFREAAEEAGALYVENREAALGISRSVVLGLQALPPCEGAVFMVADQPFLRRETVAELIRLWQSRPDRIAALAHQGKRGNPCLFPRRFFPELLQLTGDRGGSAVIRRHEQDLLLLEADGRELADVDTPELLRALSGANG